MALTLVLLSLWKGSSLPQEEYSTEPEKMDTGSDSSQMGTGQGHSRVLSNWVSKIERPVSRSPRSGEEVSFGKAHSILHAFMLCLAYKKKIISCKNRCEIFMFKRREGKKKRGKDMGLTLLGASHPQLATGCWLWATTRGASWSFSFSAGETGLQALSHLLPGGPSP